MAIAWDAASRKMPICTGQCHARAPDSSSTARCGVTPTSAWSNCPMIQRYVPRSSANGLMASRGSSAIDRRPTAASHARAAFVAGSPTHAADHRPGDTATILRRSHGTGRQMPGSGRPAERTSPSAAGSPAVSRIVSRRVRLGAAAAATPSAARARPKSESSRSTPHGPRFSRSATRPPFLPRCGRSLDATPWRGAGARLATCGQSPKPASVSSAVGSNAPRDVISSPSSK